MGGAYRGAGYREGCQCRADAQGARVMDRAQIVKRAVKILGADCEKDVQEHLDLLEEVSWICVRRTSKGKIAAGRLARALRDVETALKNEHLSPLLIWGFPTHQ